MKRPAFQFYTGDWQRNANLRRCTFAERGIWVDVLCLLHDSDEYGVLRWPLEELANAVGCRVADLQSIRRKAVLKGADAGERFPGYQVRPRHAGREGDAVPLLAEQDGPLWFSSRMVWDEHKRKNSGGDTRIGPGGEPPPSPSRRDGDGEGSGQGHGASSSSSSSPPSSLRSEGGKRARKRAETDGTPVPPDFGISERVLTWAKGKGFLPYLASHLESFVNYARAGDRESGKPILAIDWEAKFMKAIAEDWGDVRRNIQREQFRPGHKPPNGAARPGEPWYITWTGIQNEGLRRGIAQDPNESDALYTEKVFSAAGVTRDQAARDRREWRGA